MRYFILTIGLCVLFLSCQNKDYTTITSLKDNKALLIQRYKELCNKSAQLAATTTHKNTLKQTQQLFKECRLAYKKVESSIAFYFPETTSKINGAAIDKNDIQETSKKIEKATGFQKVEELLFATNPDLEALNAEIKTLNGYINTLKVKVQNLELTDSNIFEAQKLEMVRLMSHSITGYDSPIALHSLPESIAILQSIQEIIAPYKHDDTLNTTITNAIAFIQKESDFNRFNRAQFILKYCIPISKKIHAIQNQLHIPNNTTTGALNFDKVTIVAENAFNIDYFAPYYNKKPTTPQITLGEKLFTDTILSGDNTVSCTTCHVPSQAYADHKKTALNNKQSRNTPTLLNAGFQNVLFLDSRVNFLEDQAKAVINNKDEMHGSFAHALQKVKASKKYQQEFKLAYPTSPEITEINLLKSIASYIRTLSKLNSKFDAYLRGQASITKEEENGFNIYMGKGKCATCHFFPLFNGSIPPLYDEIESEVLGVPQKNQLTKATIDPDLGEYNVHKAPLKKYAFRTPTVRNTAITFPYMHNGVYNTLEEVITFYNKGGGYGTGISLDNQTLSKDELHLTKKEIQDLISFIKTLNTSY